MDKEKFNKIIGETIREVRIKKNMTQNEIALLMEIEAHQEGFYGRTRSRRNNNPGNIGNTDSGANRSFPTLKDGILAQVSYIQRIANGTNSAHKFGSRLIRPYYSNEISKNQSNYKASPYLPGLT